MAQELGTRSGVQNTEVQFVYGAEVLLMTHLLNKAFEQASALPDQEQNEFAAFILEELASDRRWAKLLSESSEVLKQLAEEARKEHAAGETERLDLDAG